MAVYLFLFVVMINGTDYVVIALIFFLYNDVNTVHRTREQTVLLACLCWFVDIIRWTDCLVIAFICLFV